MFAKPNEIGSAESLTTEIENVAGSLRLKIALPFEARRYEFSLPAGEESLDGSNEDEVPVLRRVIDTHTGEVIRTTSLPTVIKEVCIARFGGVRTRSEWFSARATLSASIGATDGEVRNAIEGFEASEPTVAADGGRERLPRFCPNDDERLVPREEEPLEVECPECGYSSPRNLRGETVKVCHKKASISENSRGENEAYMATLEIGGIENRIAVTREFVREAVTEDEEPEVMTDGGEDIGQRRYNELKEVYSDLIERHQGYKADAQEARREFQSSGEVDDEIRLERSRAKMEECIENVRAIEELLNQWDEEDSDDEPKPVTDGGHRRVPESGEEGTLTVVEEASGEYVELSGEVDHASRCESRVYDGEDDETGFMAEGVSGYLDVDGRRISFNTASDRVTEHHPEAEEAEDAVEFVGALVETEFENDGELMADGGEEPTESGEESEEPVRWGDWSNVREERNSERLMTDGGSRVHPDDGGVEILNSENDDGSDIIDAGDDGEIMADGGRPVREEEEFRTLMGEYNPDKWNPEPDPDYYRSGEVSIHDPIEGEAYSEPGHWADRPADMDTDHARRLALRGEFDDLDEHQPLPLISSDMRGVPTEGVQGSYSEVVELDESCPECSQCWGIYSVVTMAGVHMLNCLICEHTIEQG